MIDADLFSFYGSGRDGLCPINGFGLHQRMPPGFIRHDSTDYLWLFMLFHSPATIYWNPDDECQLDRGLMVWRPGDFHHYGNAGSPWDHSWLALRHPETGDWLSKYPLPSGPLSIDADALFEKYLTLLNDEVAPGKPSDRIVISKLCELFIIELHRLTDHHSPPVPENLRRVERLLIRRLGDPLNLSELASSAGMSASHFIMLFKRFYGMSPIRYHFEQRMRKAAYLLRHSSCSCKEIAIQCGYNDPLYFSRRFHLWSGTTAGNYRCTSGGPQQSEPADKTANHHK